MGTVTTGGGAGNRGWPPGANRGETKPDDSSATLQRSTWPKNYTVATSNRSALTLSTGPHSIRKFRCAGGVDRPKGNPVRLALGV